jgi:hypothetical protein
VSLRHFFCHEDIKNKNNAYHNSFGNIKRLIFNSQTDSLCYGRKIGPVIRKQNCHSETAKYNRKRYPGYFIFLKGFGGLT